jgi:oligopeptide/dipeptide ABC transporter ATP-binding protein
MSDETLEGADAPDHPPAWWRGDFVHGFVRSPVAIVSATIVAMLLLLAILAPFVAPYDVRDPAKANVVDARLPPGSTGMFGDQYPLGTDPQGRDMRRAARERARADLPMIPGAMPRLDALPRGCAFHPRCPVAIARCARERPPFVPAGPSGGACWLVADGASGEVPAHA